jgi:hypothetical protein
MEYKDGVLKMSAAELFGVFDPNNDPLALAKKVVAGGEMEALNNEASKPVEKSRRKKKGK